MLPLANIMKHNSRICHYNYADDTQIYTTMSPGNYDPLKQQFKVINYLKLINLKGADQARGLGVVLDSDLNLRSPIKTITELAFYHLNNISRSRGLMPQQD